jgi:hypothetical protein
MGFPTEGQNHHKGIMNEKNIVNFQNVNQNNEINKHLRGANETTNWKHKGGTRMKEDAVCESGATQHKLSFKNHKSGTFDWNNTSKDIPPEITNNVKQFKLENDGGEITKTLRIELEEIFSNGFNNFDSDFIESLLNKTFNNYPEYTIINCVKNKELIMINKREFTHFKKHPEDEFVLKSTKRAKTSRQIWLKKHDGSELKTNLRLRMHLNNGITALFGKKGAVPCLKIQQDNVMSFIASCANKVTVCY